MTCGSRPKRLFEVSGFFYLFLSCTWLVNYTICARAPSTRGRGGGTAKHNTARARAQRKLEERTRARVSRTEGNKIKFGIILITLKTQRQSAELAMLKYDIEESLQITCTATWELCSDQCCARKSDKQVISVLFCI